MRDTRKQRELIGVAVAAGVIAVVGEIFKPKIVAMFKVSRGRKP